jgi:ribose 5-phosphate isomerase B
VEDDNMNVICFGARVIGYALARDLMQTFLGVCFKGYERFQRRLDKVVALEREEMPR